MTVDFRQLLSKPMDDVKRPPALPAGTYFGTIKKQEYAESNEKKTPFCRYLVELNGAGEDVDKEALAAALGESPIGKRQYRKDYYLTPDAEYRLKELLESCGIPTSGRSMGECVPDALNQPVIVEMQQLPNRQDPNEPPTNVIGNMKGTAQE